MKPITGVVVLIGLIFFQAFGSSVRAQTRVDRNVIYGMYSGSALLLDVHFPARPNGFGVVLVSGSGWTAGSAYSAAPLKESREVGVYAPPLLEAGYTVFAVTHRALPAFRYPAPVEDVQRAVRFIRHNAGSYGIRPDRIGGMGGSSGGHLIAMMATLDGRGDPEDPDPINRESSKLQCIVVRAAPSDFLTYRPSDADNGSLFLGFNLAAAPAVGSAEHRLASSASPARFVSADDSPALLIHGDADARVPFAQAELMEGALHSVGVAVKLLRIPGGGHGPEFPGAVNPPNYRAEMVDWFNAHLIG
jgi:acetyl esterase/lipase